MSEYKKYYESFLKSRIIEMVQNTKNLRALNFVYHYLLGRNEK